MTYLMKPQHEDITEQMWQKIDDVIQASLPPLQLELQDEANPFQSV